MNNLGEALRALGRDEEAVHAFRDSEKISLVGGQPESAISTGHNRALALESLGRFEESRRVFRRCFDDSAKHRFWYEHVRATEGLANLAWAQSKPATALRLYRLAMREARKRGISALEPRIALNLSRLLSARGQWRAGLQLLQKYRPQFDKFVNAHLYFETLAQLFEKCARPTEAVAAWRMAKGLMKTIGDAKHESYCAERESRAVEQSGNTKLSETALRSALKTERDPGQRATLLMRHMSATKTAKAAQRSFDEALRLCTENSLHAQKVQLYLLVGDKDLNGDYQSKLNAFKAYAMAMITSAERDFAGVAEIVSHIVLQIALESPVNETEVKALFNDLKTSLGAELTESTEVTKFLLWPFHLATQTLPLKTQPQRFLAAVESLAGRESTDRYLDGIPHGSRFTHREEESRA